MVTIRPIYVCSVLVVVFERFCGDIVGSVDFFFNLRSLLCLCGIASPLYWKTVVL